MKIIGIIPARYASSRFPGKPLIDLKGKSMIERVYKGAEKSQKLSRIIVATDDERIVDEVNRFGGEVMMTSPNHLNGTDRCSEVINTIDCDVVVNIQGDEPLIDFRQLDALCSAFEETSVEIATLGIKGVSEEERNNPNRIKIVLNQKGDAMYFSRSAIPSTAHADTTVLTDFDFYRHIGVYAFRAKTLKELPLLRPTAIEKVESLEQLRWLYYGYSIRVVPTTIETPNIDTPEDVKKVLDCL